MTQEEFILSSDVLLAKLAEYGIQLSRIASSYRMDITYEATYGEYPLEANVYCQGDVVTLLVLPKTKNRRVIILGRAQNGKIVSINFDFHKWLTGEIL